MILTAHPAVSTARMTWVPATRMFVAEASEIGPFTRVYDDACDVGMTLISQRTGNAVTFVVNHTERDAEGDVLYDDLVPADFKPRGFTVRIFND